MRSDPAVVSASRTPHRYCTVNLPAEEVGCRTSKVIDQSYAVQTTELTRAAYRDISSTYVVCENDQGPPP
ncbi:hypothetical protein F4814DRAFT_406880 [Daldinia grandis]|nr:hypothetical protein F4814DRAFT_406880 [Daldinia grandis]